MYIVKDHHCCPVTDYNLKIAATKANQRSLSDLLKHMSDITWTWRHENITKLKSLDDIEKMNEKNNIIVLPEDVRMPDAVDGYIKKSNYYLEYLHWNNNNYLDGFTDYDKNINVMNDEYVLCERSICDKLYDRHKMYDFLWTNQSYPSISNALLKQLNVFLRLLNRCWMTFIQGHYNGVQQMIYQIM